MLVMEYSQMSDEDLITIITYLRPSQSKSKKNDIQLKMKIQEARTANNIALKSAIAHTPSVIVSCGTITNKKYSLDK